MMMMIWKATQRCEAVCAWLDGGQDYLMSNRRPWSPWWRKQISSQFICAIVGVESLWKTLPSSRTSWVTRCNSLQTQWRKTIPFTAEVGWLENRKWCRVPFDRMIAEYLFKKIFDIFTLTQPYQSLTFESEGVNQHRNALLYIHMDAIYCNILFFDTCMFVLFNM